MEWQEIYDPKDGYEFRNSWSFVSAEYEASEIQKMINENGVVAMVQQVNEHFRHSHPYGHKVLMIDSLGGRKIIREFDQVSFS